MTPLTLTRRRSGLHGLDLGASLVLHALVATALMASRGCGGGDRPLFDADEVMMVQMVSLPKARGRLPDRATRAPAPAAGVPEAITPSSPSDMAFRDDRAEPQKGVSTADRRKDLLEALRRDQASSAPSDAPLGDVDRAATDPDGSLSDEVLFGGSGSGIPADPDLARYNMELRQAVIPHWTPLPRIIQENPTAWAVVEVRLALDGRVDDVRVARSSGIASFDESCLRAVSRAGRLPLPPSRFPNLAQDGILLMLTASDAR
ncbi:MAG: TonB C-terminal domain-containing protein [Deltaproteobacteria bacterium]|nr:TonB C-terminal domain-containing protein [Deltaproteobacteria bacterium]